MHRIVSLVPSLTELVCDLGLRQHLVGRTKFCVHPADLTNSVPVIGGTKNIRSAAIRTLEPTLILAAKEENVAEQVEPLEDLCEVWLTDVQNLGDSARLITALGSYFGAEARATAVLTANVATLAQLAQPNRGSAAYLIWRDPYMSIGGDTYIHSVLTRLGYANACAHHLRYPNLSDEALTRLAPKHVLLSSEPFPFRARHLAELQQICPNAEVSLVDGELFGWYGSRLGHLSPGT